MSEHEASQWRPWITGWSDDILPWYAAIAPTLPRGARVVEVGVAHGRSAVFLAEQLVTLGRTDVELWCVDFWPGGEFKNVCRTLYGPGTRFAELELLRIIRCDGVRAARLFDDRSLDMVFIDSDHEYAGMCAHLDAWVPKLKADGRIAGHDYSSVDWPGVVRAVDERFGARVKHPTRSVWEVKL